MNHFPPEGATCPGHPEAPATWTCGRCGSFMCAECERRTRPEARPMCPACWELRGRNVTVNQARSGTGLQTAGLVLGVISLIPMCVAIQIASLVLNIVALVKSKEPPADKVRWQPITGLILTAVGLVATVLIAVLN
ncbi:B-box zinc finger protein [Hyalangium rubrum]|uniref:B-box zinc finger protein n=1 Tax=Hyalangium rubrum TaxID=3103134 RepID=A0ABU5GZA9_9BACT|nr:B-box zinc finger protein [Hyalangium sp. s54d21]MDY7226520.1 B-box zinc finger protein [Hyalangium sp. s54d21]